VARLRSQRAMRPHLAVRMARVTGPAAPVAARVEGVDGAVKPDDGAQVTYPAVSTTSAESTAGAALRGQKATRVAAQAAIRSHVVLPQPKGSASATIRPILKRKVIGSRYATPVLTVRTDRIGSTSGRAARLGGLASDVGLRLPASNKRANVQVSIHGDSGRA
jgi:hypothetical protein